MKKFNKIEQSEILEIARVALADADICEMVAESLDLSDDYIQELLEKIQEHSNGVVCMHIDFNESGISADDPRYFKTEKD